ncbi:hypothetical protein DFJ73DRAFT_867876 [Zopfochytrium polystomum]|nr:hypothetical protein DFJ73DRAFT_867876 [Zopfochytrium polystomum]
MLSVIELVKTKLRIILDQVERKHGLATKRVAFVGYRDFCDGADRIVSKGLTSDLPSVQAFIDGVPAKGGGDTPEDVVGGIYTASMLDWKARYCTLLHFADAPGHGREWNGGADDNHSDDSEIAVPESRTARAVEHLQRLMGKRVYYTFVCVNSERYTAATVSKIRAAYEQEGKGKRFQKMEMHSMGAFDQTVENLVNAISMSIMGQV